MILKIFIISITLLFSSLISAQPLEVGTFCNVMTKKLSAHDSLCKNVNEAVCNSVKKEERRDCSESTKIFNKSLTANELFNFAKGCLGSAVTSFTQFFTDFLPDLIQEMWKLTTNVVTNSKGMYESVRAVAVDFYEAAMEDPSAYFQHIWNKLEAQVSNSIAKFDCYKSQVKVEKICSAVSGWVLPPAVFAKLIVKGMGAVKNIKKLERTENLEEVLKQSESRKITSFEDHVKLEEMKAHEKKYLNEVKVEKGDGIVIEHLTKDEFLRYSDGVDFNLDEAASLKAKEGKRIIELNRIQAEKDKIKRLEKEKREKLLKTSDTNLPKPISSAYSSNYLEVVTKNEMGVYTVMPLELVEKMHDNGIEKFIVKIYDPTTRDYFKKTISVGELKAMKPKESEKAVKLIEKFKNEFGDK